MLCSSQFWSSSSAAFLTRRAGVLRAKNNVQLHSSAATTIRRGVSSFKSSTSLISSAAAAFSRPHKRHLSLQPTGKNETRPPTMARASASDSPPPPSSPGRPLDLPPLLWIVGVFFGLGWLTTLAVAPSALPAGMRDFALSALSVAGLGTVDGARSVASVAWGIHVLEGAYAAKLVLDGGGDAGAAAWWGTWSFLVGFPAVLMAKESVKGGDASRRDD